MLTREKKLKAIRGNGYRFVPKGGTFPTENHHACCEKLRFVRSIYPTLPQMGQNLYHDMLMPLHDSMPSFMNFRRVLDLLEFKNQASQCFAGNQRCPGVWNSFPFLAWDLSMHPRTQIWFFNQFICTGACACISNLNYAHKGDMFPLRTTSLLERSSDLQEAYTQTCTKWDKIFTTACRCRSMIACQISWISDEFWIY